MLEQLGMLNLDETGKIAEQIIGNLDDDGLPRREISLLLMILLSARILETNELEVGELVLPIQQFDPLGIAARSLQELPFTSTGTKRYPR